MVLKDPVAIFTKQFVNHKKGGVMIDHDPFLFEDFAYASQKDKLTLLADLAEIEQELQLRNVKDEAVVKMAKNPRKQNESLTSFIDTLPF